MFYNKHAYSDLQYLPGAYDIIKNSMHVERLTRQDATCSAVAIITLRDASAFKPYAMRVRANCIIFRKERRDKLITMIEFQKALLM